MGAELLGIAGLGLQAVGVLGGFFAEREKAAAERAAGAYQYAKGMQEAALAEEATAQRVRIGERQLIRVLGAQRVAYAKGGVIITSGTPLAMQLQTVRQGEEDIKTIQRMGAMYRQAALNEAALGAYRSRLGKMAGYGSLLAGLGSIALGGYRLFGGGAAGA